MADNDNKGGGDLDANLLDEALKEFDAGGGFSGKPKGINTPPKPQAINPTSPAKPPSSGATNKTTSAPPAKPQTKKPILDEEFPHFDDDDLNDAPPPKSKPEQSANNKVASNQTTAVQPVSKPVSTTNTSAKPKPSPTDFDDFDDDDDIIDGDLIDDKSSGGGGGGKKGGSGGGDGKDGDRKAMIIKKLKEPKNMIIMGIAFLFLLFLVFSGGGKRKKPQSQIVENAEAQKAVDADIEMVKKDEKLAQAPENASANQIPNISLADIQLPNLDIQVPDVRPTNVELTPNIPEIKPKPPEEVKIEEIKPPEMKPDIININEIKKKDLPEAVEEDIIQDVDIANTSVKKRDKVDKEGLKPIVTDFTGGTKITKDKKKNNTKDFIFVDVDVDAEAEDNVIKGTKIQDPENVVAQGRIIDAVLETAVNSTIGGQVRAIVTRDVYAETGRNILIPKGTRLYGEYGGANGKQAGDRIVITWTRIMRPDNISANINSFAADQFGRSGIQGHSDSKYFANISTSVLLSTIPLVTTIVTNAITNSRQNSVTTNGVGGTTIVQDPVNIATQAFTKQIGDATAQIIKEMGDLKPTITLEQGTRVKVLVNQDIKLPVYKSITKISSGVTQ